MKMRVMKMGTMGIELIPLCTASVGLAPPIILPATPEGTLMIFEVESARVEGERICASLRGRAAADWLRTSPDGAGTLDVRITLETDDGALIYGAYRGRVDLSRPAGEGPVYAAPLFSTGDPRYLWLNKIQVLAKGEISEGGRRLDYEMFEVS